MTAIDRIIELVKEGCYTRDEIADILLDEGLTRSLTQTAARSSVSAQISTARHHRGAPIQLRYEGNRIVYYWGDEASHQREGSMRDQLEEFLTTGPRTYLEMQNYLSNLRGRHVGIQTVRSRVRELKIKYRGALQRCGKAYQLRPND